MPVPPMPEESAVRRLLAFLRLVLVLAASMYAAWFLSATLVPQGFLRPFAVRIFSARVGEFTFWRILLANLFPFLAVPFMNLYRVNEHPGGAYVLPIFWVIYGLLLGTNSFVFAGQPVPLSISVLWQRTGFTEALAYTASYEATREWALWEQQGLWSVRRLVGKKWRPEAQDWAYWIVGLVLLILAAAREVR